MYLHTRSLSTCAGSEMLGLNSKGNGGHAYKLTLAEFLVSFLLSHFASISSMHLDRKSYPYGKSHYGRAFYVMSYSYYSPNYRKGMRLEKNDRIQKTADMLNKIKTEIEKRGLGTVIVAPDSPNPVHSCHTIMRSAIFTPDHEAIWWYVKRNKYAYALAMKKGARALRKDRAW